MKVYLVWREDMILQVTKLMHVCKTLETAENVASVYRIDALSREYVDYNVEEFVVENG